MKYGRFGGQYVPPELKGKLQEIKKELKEAKKDKKFLEEYQYI